VANFLVRVTQHVFADDVSIQSVTDVNKQKIETSHNHFNHNSQDHVNVRFCRWTNSAAACVWIGSSERLGVGGAFATYQFQQVMHRSCAVTAVVIARPVTHVNSTRRRRIHARNTRRSKRQRTATSCERL